MYHLNFTQIADTFVELESVFNGILKTFYLVNTNSQFKDIISILIYHRQKKINIVENLSQTFEGIKFNLVVECTFQQKKTLDSSNILPVLIKVRGHCYRSQTLAISHSVDCDKVIKATDNHFTLN